MSAESFTLTSGDLQSKWGFMDGDLFQDWVLEHRSAGSTLNDHEVLKAAVRKHLLPLLPGIPVMEMMSLHNPIRVDIDYDGEVPLVSVTITPGHLVALFPQDLQIQPS